MTRKLRRLLSGSLLPLALLPGFALALDFRSVAAERAILYDAPSLQAKRLYLVNRLYPVEVIVALEAFAKVRDSAGGLAWIETKHLSSRRTVVVTVPLADARQAADSRAAIVFQAERDVALELIEYAAAGWLKVRHQDGQIGFVRIAQVWGA